MEISKDLVIARCFGYPRDEKFKAGMPIYLMVRDIRNVRFLDNPDNPEGLYILNVPNEELLQPNTIWPLDGCLAKITFKIQGKSYNDYKIYSELIHATRLELIEMKVEYDLKRYTAMDVGWPAEIMKLNKMLDDDMNDIFDPYYNDDFLDDDFDPY